MVYARFCDRLLLLHKDNFCIRNISCYARNLTKIHETDVKNTTKLGTTICESRKQLFHVEFEPISQQ